MIDDQLRAALIAEAIEARKNAYVPYSQYPVGAALLTVSGQIFRGVNVESAAYPTTICAERAAVFSAVTAGERQFRAVAVVTANGGAPCGSCRQVLAEFGLDTIVLIADTTGTIHHEMSIAELLPASFGPANLLE